MAYAAPSASGTRKPVEAEANGGKSGAKPQASSALIAVKIGAMDALSGADSKATERFRKGYEAAFFYAIGSNEKLLKKCGYKVELALEEYPFSDPVAPRDAAARLAAAGAWIILGPTNSKHYIIASQASADTGFVSVMAGARAVALGCTDLKKASSTMRPP